MFCFSQKKNQSIIKIKKFNVDLRKSFKNCFFKNQNAFPKDSNSFSFHSVQPGTFSPYSLIHFFQKFHSQGSYAFDKLSYTIPSSSESLLPIFDNAPIYYIEQPKQLNTSDDILNFAGFCQVTEQPRYHLKYYKNLHDQTDESVLKNQSHVLSVDNMLYILSDDGLLRAYNMTFQDESQNPMSNVLELYHIHEIYLNEGKILPQELTLGDYVKLLYEENNHMLFVVSSKITYALSLDFDQRHTWMKPIKLDIPNKDYIVRADIVDGFLYILRTFNSLEIWDVSNVASIELVTKVNLNLVLGAQPNVIITDFDVNDGFLALIDKNSKTLYIYDVGSPYDQFSTQLIFTAKLVASPKSLFLYANKVLVLTEGEVHDNILEEFELFENKTAKFLRQTAFAGDLTDIVVGEVYVMLSFEDRVELFPHFYTDPMFAPQVLKFVDNIQGIQSINYFDVIWESNKNESDYFIMMIEGEITVAKVQALPASLSCNPQNVKPGLYFADLVMYEVDCTFVSQYCNSSQIIKKHELLEVYVSGDNLKPDGFLGQKVYKSDGTKMLFLGILCGLVLGAGLASLLWIMYMRSVREKSNHVKLTEQIDKQMVRINETANIPERIMSQDDLGMHPTKEGNKLLPQDSKSSV